MLDLFKERGLLVEDDASRMYISQQSWNGHTQAGIMCATSIVDYEENRIKKHEFTLPKKELDRTKLTSIQNASIEPVFLTFREKQDEICAKIN